MTENEQIAAATAHGVPYAWAILALFTLGIAVAYREQIMLRWRLRRVRRKVLDEAQKHQCSKCDGWFKRQDVGCVHGRVTCYDCLFMPFTPEEIAAIDVAIEREEPTHG